MNKKLILILIASIMLFSLSFVFAVPPVTTTQQFNEGYNIQVPQDNILKAGQPYIFDFHVSNISSGMPVTSNIGCYFHLYNETGGHQYSGYDSNPAFNFDYEFNLTGGNFTTNHLYYYIQCNSSSFGGFAESILIVTPNGEDLDTSRSIAIFIIYLFLFLFLIGGIYGLYKSEGAWQIAYICLAYVSLFCLFFVSWLVSSNYLYSIPILTSIFWILWLVMAFGFFPFIIVISVYIIGRGINDNLMKEYQSQGYSAEEAKGFVRKK